MTLGSWIENPPGGGDSGSGVDGATVIHKAADETVNNSSTLQDDDHLVLPVLADEMWQLEMILYFNAANSTADFKLGFTVPAGTTMFWGVQGQGSVVTWQAQAVASNPTVLMAESGTQSIGSVNGTFGVVLRGRITASSTAGNVQFQWAQDVANASDSKVLAGSHIVARKLT